MPARGNHQTHQLAQSCGVRCRSETHAGSAQQTSAGQCKYTAVHALRATCRLQDGEVATWPFYCHAIYCFLQSGLPLHRAGPGVIKQQAATGQQQSRGRNLRALSWQRRPNQAAGNAIVGVVACDDARRLPPTQCCRTLCNPACTIRHIAPSTASALEQLSAYLVAV
jgi:hypothetical protein